MPNYDPRSFRALTFHDALPGFRDGSDTPRAYLERCIATVEEREPVVKAFASLNLDTARAAADASTARWKAGAPLSAIDGMPVGIKDLLETVDHPTEMGCEAFRGNFPKRDNAAVWALRLAGAVIFGKTVTAEIGGAHVEYCRGIANPVGVKVGTAMDIDWLQRLVTTLNPENSPGKLALIHRFGARDIESA